MASNQTPNLGLSQWQRSDPFTVDDFNADHVKIDTALGTQPYKLLLRQTLTENANSIYLDLSDLDFSGLRKLRMEVFGTYNSNSSSGSDNLCLWINDTTTDYFYEIVDSTSPDRNKTNFILGRLKASSSYDACFQLCVDICLQETKLNYFSRSAYGNFSSSSLSDSLCYDYFGCHVSVGRQNLSSLRIAGEEYLTEPCPIYFHAGTTALLVAIA